MQNAREHEAAAVHTAKALAELVEQNVADESRAAALARAAARAPLSPPPAAVALGAPQLHLGVLYVAESQRLVVFQQNNSIALRQFWKTLASAWNATTVVWSNGWFSCDGDGEGWWGGVAAARGLGASRAAAAIFRRWPALPCEEAMNDGFGGLPLCDTDTTDCEATPSYGKTHQRIEVGISYHITLSQSIVETPLFAGKKTIPLFTASLIVFLTDEVLRLILFVPLSCYFIIFNYVF